MDQSSIRKVFSYSQLTRNQKIKYKLLLARHKLWTFLSHFNYCCSKYVELEDSDEILNTRLVLMSQQ